MLPARRLVILTNGRAGSELLVSLLDSHPRFVCEGELLKRGPRFPNAYVALRAARAGAAGADAFGWKLLLSHFRNPHGLVSGIGDPSTYPARLDKWGYRVVLLVRQNPIAQAMSFVQAGTTGQFHVRKEDTKGQSPQPIVVDPVHLLTSTHILALEARLLEEMTGTVPHLRVVYEDDLLETANQQATVDRLCRELDLPRAPVSTSLIRHGTAGLRERIANFEAVAALFAHTPYAHYLES